MRWQLRWVTCALAAVTTGLPLHARAADTLDEVKAGGEW